MAALKKMRGKKTGEEEEGKGGGDGMGGRGSGEGGGRSSYSSRRSMQRW